MPKMYSGRILHVINIKRSKRQVNLACVYTVSVQTKQDRIKFNTSISFHKQIFQITLSYIIDYFVIRIKVFMFCFQLETGF